MCCYRIRPITIFSLTMSTEERENSNSPMAFEIHIVWQNIVMDFYDSFNQRYQRDKKVTISSSLLSNNFCLDIVLVLGTF